VPSVLVVEDDRFKLNAVTRFLSDCIPGTEVSHADNLQSAYELLHREQYDFIILDMSIPSHGTVAGTGRSYPLKVGGLDILLEVWSTGRAEKVIILTQFPDIEFDHVKHPVSDFIEVAHSHGIRNLVASVLFDKAGAWQSVARKALGVE